MSTLKLLQNSLHSLLEIDQRVHIVELLEFFTNLASLFMSSNCPSLKFISEVTRTLVMMIPHCTTTIPSSSSMMALTNFGPEGTRKQTNFSQEFYKFSESVHRFLGRPSLLVEFVRNHGVRSSAVCVNSIGDTFHGAWSWLLSHYLEGPRSESQRRLANLFRFFRCPPAMHAQRNNSLLKNRKHLVARCPKHGCAISLYKDGDVSLVGCIQRVL